MNRNLSKAINTLEVNTYSVGIESASGETEELGSAFALSEDELLTAYHVVLDEETMNPIPKVIVRNDEDFEVTGIITKHDSVSDLAIIQCDEKLTKVKSYRFDSKLPKVGSNCIWGFIQESMVRWIHCENDLLRESLVLTFILSPESNFWRLTVL